MCSCSVCGKRRTVIEEELEMLYNAYYEELEQYEYTNNSHNNAIPPVPFPLSISSRMNGNKFAKNFVNAKQMRKNQFSNGVKISRTAIDSEDSDTDYDTYSDSLTSSTDEESEEVEEVLHSQNNLSYPSKNFFVKHKHQPIDHDDDCREKIRNKNSKPQKNHHYHHHHHHHFNFTNSQSNSLSTKEGILTVADDLLKNEGKKFLEMMEKLAEQKVKKDSQCSSHPRGDYSKVSKHSITVNGSSRVVNNNIINNNIKGPVNNNVNIEQSSVSIQQNAPKTITTRTTKYGKKTTIVTSATHHQLPNGTSTTTTTITTRRKRNYNSISNSGENNYFPDISNFSKSPNFA